MEKAVERQEVSVSREERRSFWRYHIEKIAQDGVSVRRYCREHGLSESSFHYWRQKNQMGSPERAVVSGERFTRVRLSAESFSSPIRMALGQGVVLFFEREPNPVWIKELAVVLGERS